MGGGGGGTECRTGSWSDECQTLGAVSSFYKRGPSTSNKGHDRGSN